MKHTIARFLMAGGVAGGVMVAGTASAIDFNVTGFLRQEISYGISSTENPNNLMSGPFNGRVNQNLTFGGFGAGGDAFISGLRTAAGAGAGLGNNGGAPTSLYVTPNLNGGAPIVGGIFSSFRNPVAAAEAQAGQFLPAGANTSLQFDCHLNYQRALASPGTKTGFGPRVLSDGLATFAASGAAGGENCPLGADIGHLPANDPARAAYDDINFNTFNTRAEVDVQAKISEEFAAYMKVRAYYDGTSKFTDGKIGDNYNTPFWGSRGQITEWNSPSSIIDIPALYLDWNHGPLWLRAGNQVIAWGEAYFFRTMDVANGLDLRRHLTLGPGAEEYQDQRVASPGLRLSYTFQNGWEVDSFVQMFSPTILPGQNTAYNLVSQNGARLDDSAGFDDAKGSLNFGARLNMPLTESFTGILAYVNRRNPDGVVRNVDAPTYWAGSPNSGCLNNYNDTLNVLANGVGGALFGGLGFGGGSVASVQTALAANGIAAFPTLNTAARNQENGCGSTFAPDPYGTTSQKYWSTIQSARLDNGNYIDHVINDFPAAKWAVRDIFGFGTEQNFAETYRTLEGFRSSFGPFIQWVGREFKRENLFMVGGNYVVTTDDPNSVFDQLIIRGEVSVTPDKKLTNDLTFDYTEVDDVVSALIFEKYHRFSDAFPATYMVAQWMHRTSTDLFGRDLDKNDSPVSIRSLIRLRATSRRRRLTRTQWTRVERPAPTMWCLPSSSRSEPDLALRHVGAG